ncbi:hypothetical protein QJQ45_019319 [Haematococcus lacustris]|nr:hypothetical protein QJQ45_019319 [Haematococcus lacustris]
MSRVKSWSIGGSSSRRLVSVRRKLQTTVATSTTMAEYQAVADATREALYLCKLLHELCADTGSVPTMCDSQGEVAFVKTLVESQHSKHIALMHHGASPLSRPRYKLMCEAHPTARRRWDALVRNHIHELLATRGPVLQQSTHSQMTLEQPVTDYWLHAEELHTTGAAPQELHTTATQSDSFANTMYFVMKADGAFAPVTNAFQGFECEAVNIQMSVCTALPPMNFVARDHAIMHLEKPLTSPHAAARKPHSQQPQSQGPALPCQPSAASTPRLSTQRTKGKGKAQGKDAKAKPAPQPGRCLDRDSNAALNMQRIGESRLHPLEQCWWPEQAALPAKGKGYPGLGYKRL